MKLGILQCGTIKDSLRAKHGDYPQMLTNQLAKLNPDLHSKVYKAFEGKLPDHVDTCDVYITTGSRFGVNDALPWIAPLEEFVRQLYSSEKKLVGICFGHQLIAKAMGGTVENSDKGWGVGIAFSKIIQIQPWIRPVQDTMDLIVSHQDQVIKLPPGATLLAGNLFCPNAMYQLGHHFLSMQGHPEFSKEFSHDLMLSRRDRIPPERIREGLASLKAECDSQAVLKWMMNFMCQ